MGEPLLSFQVRNSYNLRLSCAVEGVAISRGHLYSAGAEALSEIRPALTMKRLPFP